MVKKYRIKHGKFRRRTKEGKAVRVETFRAGSVVEMEDGQARTYKDMLELVEPDEKIGPFELEESGGAQTTKAAEQAAAAKAEAEAAAKEKKAAEEAAAGKK